MTLSIQIISMILSFLYGIVFSFLLNVNYHILFTGKRLFRVVSNLLFVLDMALLYFLLMKKVNNGIIHPYFYLLIFIGFVLAFKKTMKVRKIFKELPKSVKEKDKSSIRLKNKKNHFIM